MFKLAGMGGSFDHLHEGHKYLIQTALGVSEKICIGLTTEKMHKNKKFREKIQDFSIRKKNIEDFVQSFTNPNRLEIVELNDPFGPPIEEEDYEALIISKETLPNAIKINEIREDKDMKPLIFVVIPLIKEKNGKKLSSTQIRKKMK
jgi:pantetheine-phosphate adenylyltransferase